VALTWLNIPFRLLDSRFLSSLDPPALLTASLSSPVDSFAIILLFVMGCGLFPFSFITSTLSTLFSSTYICIVYSITLVDGYGIVLSSFCLLVYCIPSQTALILPFFPIAPVVYIIIRPKEDYISSGCCLFDCVGRLLFPPFNVQPSLSIAS